MEFVQYGSVFNCRGGPRRRDEDDFTLKSRLLPFPFNASTNRTDFIMRIFQRPWRGDFIDTVNNRSKSLGVWLRRSSISKNAGPIEIIAVWSRSRTLTEWVKYRDGMLVCKYLCTSFREASSSIFLIPFPFNVLDFSFDHDPDPSIENFQVWSSTLPVLWHARRKGAVQVVYIE